MKLYSSLEKIPRSCLLILPILLLAIMGWNLMNFNSSHVGQAMVTTRMGLTTPPPWHPTQTRYAHPLTQTELPVTATTRHEHPTTLPTLSPIIEKDEQTRPIAQHYPMDEDKNVFPDILSKYSECQYKPTCANDTVGEAVVSSCRWYIHHTTCSIPDKLASFLVLHKIEYYVLANAFMGINPTFSSGNCLNTPATKHSDTCLKQAVMFDHMNCQKCVVKVDSDIDVSHLDVLKILNVVETSDVVT